ncbi:MAG: DNA topoisomerase [Turicibacter sp.]
MARALLIAEKPSLMREVQAVYKTMGFPDTLDFKSFRGHTMTLLAPGDYTEDWEKWDIKQLPMIPQKFRYKVIPSEKGDYLAIFNDIKKTIETGNYDYLINCCDPGREGQLIFHSVYESLGCKLPVKRFWNNGMTENAIIDALNHMEDDLNTPRLKNMIQASKLRADFDWLIGMNFTRAFSIGANQRKALPLGRVMTPVLNIVAQREMELQDFKPKPFWELEGDFGTFKGTYFDHNNENETKFFKKEKAEAVIAKMPTTGFIESIEKKVEKKYAPSLHSLADIQREANRVYGFTMSETLEIVQELYESKFLSYPRTDSSYITKDEAKRFPQLLSAIKDVPDVVKYVGPILPDSELISKTAKNKKYVDDSKVSDHYAIIPTGKPVRYDTLTKRQQQVMSLVAKRFVAIFMPPSVVNKTTLITNCGDFKFKTNGNEVVDKGFTVLYKTKFSENSLPSFTKNDEVSVIETKLNEKATTPPSRYNDATVLEAMINAGRFLEDDSLKEVLKSSEGIGTPATRGAIIEKLINLNMIERRKKTFYATEYGISIIQNLNGHLVASPELTAQWEQKLKQIEACKLEPMVFWHDMLSYIRSSTEDFKSMSYNIQGDPKAVGENNLKTIGKCLKCGEPVFVGTNYYFCGQYKKSCDFISGKAILGTKISEANMKKILQGKPSNVLSFSKTDNQGIKKTWKAALAYNPDRKQISFLFEDDGNGGSANAKTLDLKCPNCGKFLQETGKYYLCPEHNKSCKFIVGKEYFTAPISLEELGQMLRGQMTEVKTVKFQDDAIVQGCLYLDPGTKRIKVKRM